MSVLFLFEASNTSQLLVGADEGVSRIGANSGPKKQLGQHGPASVLPKPVCFPWHRLAWLAWLNSRDRFWLFLAIEGSDLQGLTGIGDNLIINIVDPILRGKAFGSTGGN